MERVARKFESFQDAEAANDAYLASLTPEARLEILLELILPENPDEAIIERSARVYPLSERDRR